MRKQGKALHRGSGNDFTAMTTTAHAMKAKADEKNQLHQATKLGIDHTGNETMTQRPREWVNTPKKVDLTQLFYKVEKNSHNSIKQII